MGEVRGCGTSTLSTTHEDTATAAISSRGVEICASKYEKSSLGLTYIYVHISAVAAATGPEPGARVPYSTLALVC